MPSLVWLMQPEHQCTPDCETIHREIFKKIFAIIVNGREKVTDVTKANNTWVKIAELQFFLSTVFIVWTGNSDCTS